VIAAEGYQRLLASPWRWHRNDGPFMTEAAYFALIGLGLLSFFLNRHHVPGWRLAVWIGFALLGAWRLGLTPFFAVVAGPITALNMQDFLFYRGEIDRSEVSRRRGDWPLLARFLLLTFGLALVLLAGAGQVRGIDGQRRPICWRIQPDSSLERLAGTLRRWRERGLVRYGERILAFDPAIAHYCAWICPEAELCCPPPFQSGETAAAFQEVRRQLRCPPEDADRCAPLLRDWHVAYAAVEGTNALDQLIERPREWLLVSVEGRAAIFAWRSSGPAANRWTVLGVNYLAFAPPGNDDWDSPPAPSRGPERGPAVPSFWSSLRPAPPRTWESEAATTYLRYFQEAALPRYSQRWGESWSAFAASMVSLNSPMTPSPATLAPLLVRLQNPPSFLGDIDRDLPALPLLAVRAVRLALASNPDDANAYLRLGQAYLALWEKTGELPLSGGNPLLLDLRHIQIVTALEQAVLCDPENVTAHRLLGRAYLQRGFLDVALDHVRAELRLTQRIGPRRGEKAETFQGRLRELERQVNKLERDVEANQQRFDASHQEGKDDPVALAKTALALGLPRRALEDILLPVPPVLLQSGGLQLELQLMLRLGRAEQLRGPLLDPQWERDQANLSWLELPAPPVPGYLRTYRLPAYSWVRLCWAAAVGNYHLAGKQVNELLKQLRDRREHQLRTLRRSLVLALTSELGFFSDGQLLLLRPAARDARLVAMFSFVRVLAFLGDQADLSVLGGLLALERGRPDLAERSFEKARAINQADGGLHEGYATKTLAEAYERRISKVAKKP
jgi:tetratricopeptide (TPR) repeat protein